MSNILNQIIFERNFIDNSQELFSFFVQSVSWNDSMVSRKTACFGEPYDYSEQSYDFLPMSDELERVCDLIQEKVGFRPNNCLLNYYKNGTSKLGYHGDITKMLEPETGIAVVSLGDHRILQIRRNSSHTECYNYVLNSGSLFYMPNSIQNSWQHRVPKVVSTLGRISLTFRQMIPRHLLQK